jgi:hypothetical protein
MTIAPPATLNIITFGKYLSRNMSWFSSCFCTLTQYEIESDLNEELVRIQWIVTLKGLLIMHPIIMMRMSAPNTDATTATTAIGINWMVPVIHYYQ